MLKLVCMPLHQLLPCMLPGGKEPPTRVLHRPRQLLLMLLLPLITTTPAIEIQASLWRKRGAHSSEPQARHWMWNASMGIVPFRSIRGWNSLTELKIRRSDALIQGSLDQSHYVTLCASVRPQAVEFPILLEPYHVSNGTASGWSKSGLQRICSGVFTACWWTIVTKSWCQWSPPVLIRLGGGGGGKNRVLIFRLI